MVTAARHVLLDTGPLGVACRRSRTDESDKLVRWISRMLRHGVSIIVPEIADYEVRRELLRAGKRGSIEVLDSLHDRLEYLPLTTEMMQLAALFWAKARKRGKPSTSDSSLDADMILCAQAESLRRALTVVATTNAAHLTQFVIADDWANIEAA